MINGYWDGIIHKPEGLWFSVTNRIGTSTTQAMLLWWSSKYQLEPTVFLLAMATGQGSWTGLDLVMNQLREKSVPPGNMFHDLSIKEKGIKNINPLQNLPIKTRMECTWVRGLFFQGRIVSGFVHPKYNWTNPTLQGLRWVLPVVSLLQTPVCYKHLKNPNFHQVITFKALVPTLLN